MPSKARSTRAKNKVNQTSPQNLPSTRTLREKTNGKTREARLPTEVPAVSEPEDTDNQASDTYYESDDEEDVRSLHSDALDDDSDHGTKLRVGKRKRSSPVRSRASKGSSSRKKLRKSAANDENEGEEDPDLTEGQELVGKVVQAPKTGLVPPGQISQNTFDFLSQLKRPECNDREWFKLNEPVFRQAETEFKLFVEKLTDLFPEVDSEIPPLPPKDVIYRIYRDIRFSNDKTPYKTNFAATFSRSGRKGIFAGFKPGGESLLAAGTWCPGKNELATIRSHIQRNPSRLRRTISALLFVENFGPAKPVSKGRRRNIFGRDDELKTAPKGVDKDHKDIDLLKCRSFVVVHQFTDDEVLSPDFGQTVMEVIRAARPLVYCMNDYMSVGEGEDEDAEPEEEGEEEDE